MCKIILDYQKLLPVLQQEDGSEHLYLLTCAPKVQRDKELDKYMELIKEKFPVVPYVETVFKEFYTILMGNEHGKVDEFVERYSNGKMTAFCNGIKKGTIAVREIKFGYELVEHESTNNGR